MLHRPKYRMQYIVCHTITSKIYSTLVYSQLPSTLYSTQYVLQYPQYVIKSLVQHMVSCIPYGTQYAGQLVSILMYITQPLTSLFLSQVYMLYSIHSYCVHCMYHSVSTIHGMCIPQGECNITMCLCAAPAVPHLPLLKNAIK